jgi:hypothetical protein
MIEYSLTLAKSSVYSYFFEVLAKAHLSPLTIRLSSGKPPKIGQLSWSLQKYTNVFSWALTRRIELCEQLGQILAGELPFEGSGGAFPVVLKFQ